MLLAMTAKDSFFNSLFRLIRQDAINLKPVRRSKYRLLCIDGRIGFP